MAGHAGPLVIRADGVHAPEASRTRPLLAGGSKGIEQVVSVTLEPGDRVLVAGEGATEAESGAGELLGRKGLMRIVDGVRDAAAEDLLEAVERGVAEHAGGMKVDLALVLIDAESRKPGKSGGGED